MPKGTIRFSLASRPVGLNPLLHEIRMIVTSKRRTRPVPLPCSLPARVPRAVPPRPRPSHARLGRESTCVPPTSAGAPVFGLPVSTMPVEKSPKTPPPPSANNLHPPSFVAVGLADAREPMELFRDDDVRRDHACIDDRGAEVSSHHAPSNPSRRMIPLAAEYDRTPINARTARWQS